MVGRVGDEENAATACVVFLELAPSGRSVARSSGSGRDAVLGAGESFSTAGGAGNGGRAGVLGPPNPRRVPRTGRIAARAAVRVRGRAQKCEEREMGVFKGISRGYVSLLWWHSAASPQASATGMERLWEG